MIESKVMEAARRKVSMFDPFDYRRQSDLASFSPVARY